MLTYYQDIFFESIRPSCKICGEPMMNEASTKQITFSTQIMILFTCINPYSCWYQQQQFDMLKKIAENPYASYFYMYWYIEFLCGMYLSALGPLIPYFSQITGIEQTQYAFLFSCRSAGMVVGALLQKTIPKFGGENYHKILFVSCLVFFVSCVAFSFSIENIYQGIWMILISVAFLVMQIYINICVFSLSPQKEIQLWLLLLHGILGVGGLIGPMLVYIFQTHAYAIIGCLFIIVLPIVYKFQSPKRTNEETKLQSNQKVIPHKVEIALGLFIFVYVGCEAGFGGWISSFSIMAGVSSKQEGTFYSTVFWIALTLSRLLVLNLSGTTTYKMGLLLKAAFLTGLVSIFFIKIGLTHIGCYVSCILFGSCFSSLYPLNFAIAAEYGYGIADHQTANIVSFGSLGQGILAMLIGQLMEIFNINYLYYSLIVLIGVLLLLRHLNMKWLESPKQPKSQLQLELVAKYAQTS